MYWSEVLPVCNKNKLSKLAPHQFKAQRRTTKRMSTSGVISSLSNQQSAFHKLKITENDSASGKGEKVIAKKMRRFCDLTWQVGMDPKLATMCWTSAEVMLTGMGPDLSKSLYAIDKKPCSLHLQTPSGNTTLVSHAVD